MQVNTVKQDILARGPVLIKGRSKIEYSLMGQTNAVVSKRTSRSARLKDYHKLQ